MQARADLSRLWAFTIFAGIFDAMKRTLGQRFAAQAQADFPELFSGKRFLLAFSGGVDSTVLGHLLYGLSVPFAVAHCHFHLRGAESDRDADFARCQAWQWGVEFFSKDFATREYARKKKISVEMAARELRYGWFGELMREQDFAAVLTAHHGDDQVETVLLNLTRGTSLDGLLGIKPRSEWLWRPLLAFSREEIEAYARENGWPWVEDSTNAGTDYTRNCLRHRVVPVLKQINPSLVASLAENTAYLRSLAGLYGRLAGEKAQAALVRENGRDKIRIAAVEALGTDAEALWYYILKRYGLESRTSDVVDAVRRGQSGAEFFAGGYRALRDRDFVIVEPWNRVATPAGESCRIAADVRLLESPLRLSFSLREKDGPLRFDGGPKTAYFDADALAFPLELRRAAPGDSFCPVGMGGRRKKLSKYFKDEKLPVFDKERAWVLCSADGRVAWAVGMRASEEFAVGDRTRRVLTVRLENESENETE